MPNQYNQPAVTIVLTTHAHAPPLRPAPQLKYDLRTIPNPPKAIRDACTGVSKRLREHMLEYSVFVELLGRAEVEICDTVESMFELWRADKYKEFRGSTNHEDVISEKDESKIKGDEFESEAEDERGDEDGSTTPFDADNLDQVVLTVGIFCARGQHRSVAFAEELSKASWPKNWVVIVTHRDLGQKRGSAKNHNGRDRKVRGADMLDDE